MFLSSASSTDLIDAATVKISRYLLEGKNAAYAESKLVGALRGHEAQVRQSMEDATTRPKKAAATILSPTDFTFRFWTHLSNLVLQDIRAKSDRTDIDQGACQSAYIIGYAVFHKKGAVQKEQDWAVDRKSLEVQVRKAPFVFGFPELFALKDGKGAPYVSKHSRVHHLVPEGKDEARQARSPSLSGAAPRGGAEEGLLHPEGPLVPVFLKKLGEAAEELRTLYLDGWTAECARSARRRSPPASRVPQRRGAARGTGVSSDCRDGQRRHAVHRRGEETTISETDARRSCGNASPWRTSCGPSTSFSGFPAPGC